MELSITIKDPYSRLNDYIFQNHTPNKISDCTEKELDKIRTFFNSIRGQKITDMAIFRNRLVGKKEEIIKCSIKDHQRYDFNFISQSTNTLFSQVTDLDMGKKDKLVTFLHSIYGKTLSFRKRDNEKKSINQYKQNELPTLNTRGNCLIFSPKATIDRLTKALLKYNELYAPNGNLTYGSYPEELKAKQHGFINNWVGIIVIVLGLAFIIFKLLEYIK